MDTSLLMRLNNVVAVNDTRSTCARGAADLIRKASRARWVGIYTVADGLVINEAWSGPSAPAYPTFPVTQGLTAHAIHTGAIAVSNDVERDPRYLTNQDDSGSELIVPVLNRLDVVGTLDIESADIGAFNGTEITHYELLANALLPLWDQSRND